MCNILLRRFYVACFLCRFNSRGDAKVFSGPAWYDIELQQYQKDRQDTELERFFDERHQAQQESGHHTIHIMPKHFKGTEAEWQQEVKRRKNEEYYSKLQELENEQVTREIKLRESTHQFAIPGDKIVASTIAKGMAQKYEDKL